MNVKNSWLNITRNRVILLVRCIYTHIISCYNPSTTEDMRPYDFFKIIRNASSLRNVSIPC